MKKMLKHIQASKVKSLDKKKQEQVKGGGPYFQAEVDGLQLSVQEVSGLSENL